DEVQRRFTYGLPELNREQIKESAYISNPGCYASTCILAAAPLASAGYKGQLFFDGKSGSSGAGRTPQPSFHHPQANGNAFAYKLFAHRHEPEIAEKLAGL